MAKRGATGRRRLGPLYAILGCIIGILGCGPALAQDNGGGFFGTILQSLQNAAAQAAWQTVEPDVQNCLASQYNLNPADLASQGIGPGDPRVAPDVQSCRQAVAQQQQQGGDQQQQASVDPAEKQKELTAKYGRKAAKQIMAGNIDIGMNQDEVIAAWGDPTDRQQGSGGKEKWVYGDDTVTFTKGKVTSVGH